MLVALERAGRLGPAPPSAQLTRRSDRLPHSEREGEAARPGGTREGERGRTWTSPALLAATSRSLRPRTVSVVTISSGRARQREESERKGRERRSGSAGRVPQIRSGRLAAADSRPQETLPAALKRTPRTRRKKRAGPSTDGGREADERDRGGGQSATTVRGMILQNVIARTLRCASLRLVPPSLRPSLHCARPPSLRAPRGSGG